MAKQSVKKGALADLFHALIIVAAGLWIYSPVFHGEWIWDDLRFIPQNPLLHDPARLWKIWFQPQSLHEYYPIEATVQWAQWELWHNDTLGYHVTNVVLHLLSAFLLWHLFSKLHLRLAWLGALLFTVHPLMVESVAWMVELKNTLSLPPLLLAMCAWIDYEEAKRPKDYFLALGLFLVAMLCKITVVMFPVVILLYAWWKRARIGWSDLKVSAPFFILALAVGLITIMSGLWDRLFDHLGPRYVPAAGGMARLVLAGLEIAFYFSKSVLPVGLLPVYPKWTVDPSSPVQYLPWVVLLGVIGWLWTKRQSWGRHVLLGLGFFLINLTPCPGFIPPSNMGYAWVMDHFLYLPIIGLIGLAIAGLESLDTRLPVFLHPYGMGGLAMVMALLAFESRSYAGLFINRQTLWTYTLQHNPQALPAHSDLSIIFLDAGRTSEALEQAEEAVRLAPDSDVAHSNLGNVFFKTGRFAEALQQFVTALKINPDNAKTHNELGATLAQSGRFAEAMEQFNQAVRIQPDFADAFVNRGQLKRLHGDLNGAIADLDQAGAFNPDLPQPYLNRGVLKQAQGDAQAALSNLRRFRQLAPKDPNADYALLWIWIIRNQQDQKTDADQEFAAAFSKNWNAAPGDWASQNQRFLLGQINETEYLAAAVSADKNKDQGQHCEAWYYAGMKRLLTGDKITAAADFRACLATGKINFFEYTLAQAELNALHPS